MLQHKMPLCFYSARTGELLTTLSNRMIVGGMSWYFISVLSNPTYASFLYGSYYLSKLFFGVLLSPLGDILNKKYMLAFCSAISVLVSGILLSFGDADLNTFLLLLGILFIAVGDSYLSGIMNAIIPDLVPAKHMESAYQSSFLLQSLANILGITLGVLGIEALGIRAVLLCALIFTVIALCLFLSLPRINQDKTTFEQHYLQEAINGIKLSYRYRTEFYWNILSSFANFAIAPLIAMIVPYFVATVVQREAFFVATLELALTLGVFFAATYLHVKIAAMLPKMWIVQGAFIGIGSSLALLAFSNSLVVWHGALFLLGTFIILNNISIESVRALAIPKQYRARLQVVHQLFIQSSVPLGFYVFTFQESLEYLPVILLGFVLLFFISASCISKVPHLKSLLLMDESEIDGAYGKLFKSELLK